MINIPLYIVKLFKISTLSLILCLNVQAQDTVVVSHKQTGTASFYNRKFDGRHTSSGELLNNSRYTAAHCSIPFGTMVRITNQANNKSVVVKINDRFYPRKGHLIDLTYAAAKDIDMVRQGIARVTLEVLDITESEAEAKAIIPADTITFRLFGSKILLPSVKPKSDHLRTNLSAKTK